MTRPVAGSAARKRLRIGGKEVVAGDSHLHTGVATAATVAGSSSELKRDREASENRRLSSIFQQCESPATTSFPRSAGVPRG